VPESHRSAQNNLDLVPIMNLVTILIPFLLMSAQFVAVATIDSSAPGITDKKSGAEKPDSVEVMVTIAEDGMYVSADDEVTTLPCAKGICDTARDYDLPGLTYILGLVKDQHPHEDRVVLAPDSTIPYEVLVASMDASRQDGERELFPRVVIASQ
jgi:biopolymer transport protein TolR